ncbi:prolipoprotein diacylglyceryl transferase [Thermosulfurimonas sp. F29]|uniref:prolipoprotein diacylglyceryl transferase n=1 Tax=Thermosulfurimonas sp. F29 TaxID=2867247 RepID=UPI001C82E76A|nr:prolipoprotein diacylglyceryl transferase [Thermosulfurimonas sp. F29]MBX6422370.1 prolipoprotein diacylglyceryl transferase [Thermosulfurimonas sp. F29]
MLPYPQINPEIVRIGPVAVRWYGLMYLLGFLAAYYLARKQLRERGHPELVKVLEDVLFWGGVGLIVGARLGHVFFYYPGYYLKRPLEILAVWHGGMSFHGGLIGAVVAGWIYARRRRLNFFWWADLLVVTAPIGLGLGRLGNFINGELYGRPTHVPWAMVFPAGGPVPRHPSQLYEALGEGLLLFLILWSVRRKDWAPGLKLALFLVLYGVIRFFLEFFREPDPGVGLFFGWMTRGQFFCLLMVLVGAVLFLVRRGAPEKGPYLSG